MKFGPKEDSMGKEENKSKLTHTIFLTWGCGTWGRGWGVTPLTKAGSASCLIPTLSVLFIFCQQWQINRKAFSWCPRRLQKQFTWIISVSEKSCVRLVPDEQGHGLRDRGAVDQSVPCSTCMRQRLCRSEGSMGKPQLGLSRKGAVAGIRGNGCCGTWGWEMGHWAHLLWPHLPHRLFPPSL